MDSSHGYSFVYKSQILYFNSTSFALQYESRRFSSHPHDVTAPNNPQFRPHTTNYQYIYRA